MRAINPSFLKCSPQIFGMELKDILFLSILISIQASLDFEGITILAWTALFLVVLVGKRKLFQKNYFEFLLFKKRFSFLYVGSRARKGSRL